ncbi:alpha-ketoglutarate-dependent dioxygenase AlkB [Algoriphagus terrigena]|uniref:alpha-ketoglutarate-dependent dioxygenase AlkB n=1 Tax=Algoriphagus terrigena TaxID=344884 RepID=UPI00040C59E9|nr:alpha-ketoglutarate-dependent dioxygenase AlkB [Algoriphagus terrigena]
MQISLFDSSAIDNTSSETRPKTLNDLALLSNVKGLLYIPEYITKEEHLSFWQSVNSENWLGDLKRRVQHYGYKYDYKARFIDYSMRIGELPDWVIGLAKRLHEDGYMTAIPDQLIVNEYMQGQGIASHVDCEPCFGDTIISLSLGSTCVMDFTNKMSKEKIEVFLEPRSLVVLKEDARYLWTHGIAGKKTDQFKGQKYERDTRISLTFRNVILNSCEIKK